MNIYAVKDKVSGSYYTVFLSESDSAAVRDNLMYLTRVKPVDDIEISCLGTFDTNDSEIHGPSYIVPLDSYHFEEKVMEDMKKPVAQRELELYTLQQKIQIERSMAELEEQKTKLEQLRRRGDVPQNQ